MLVVTIRPTQRYDNGRPKPVGSLGVVWIVSHEGEDILKSSKPFGPTLRFFRACGYSPDTLVEMYHEGEIYPSLQGTVGASADLWLEERREGLVYVRRKEAA